jgi:phosphatidylserine decarboxylase
MIARDGWSFILIGLVLTVVALWGCTRWDSLILLIVGLIFSLATIFSVYFFRDPDRSFVAQPDLLVSPADGTIVKIDTLDNHPFVGDGTVRVSIFLSIFNVHVQRIPIDGTIDYVNYIPGEFFAAYEDKASEKNEQTEIGLVTTSGQKIAFKQIAGLIARRIVCHLSAGQSVTAGDRFGLIRFGSRVDMLLPPSAKLNVKLGDGVRGGETIVGTLASEQPTIDTSADKEGHDGGL